MEFVDKNETLARFITSKRHYGTLRNEVKYNLFMPPQDLKLSVYRTDTITEQEKWDIGDKFVAPFRGSILGSGEFLVSSAEEQGLKATVAPNPHPLHSELIGWPSGQPDKQKQVDIAQQLVIQSFLVLRPKSP